MTDKIQTQPSPLDNIPVTLSLNVGMVNYILAVLAKRPLEECMNVFTAIKQQGDAAVAAATAPPPAPAPAPAPDAAPAAAEPATDA